ncbi:hypothetical protein B0A49_00778 [Cryomyces minteri]|uniref:Derlin n=1 Tax=Cryomyces minteri TaxID=331657 RepID=A0A4U0XLQ8_9PEZI|nr:hypothetical protein B0A49_00778 [Cryomyces minteri]
MHVCFAATFLSSPHIVVVSPWKGVLNTGMDIFWAAPPVSRTLTAAVVLTSAAVYGGLLSGMRVVFYRPWILTLFPQLWRLVTPFLLTGPKLGMILDPYFLYTYGSSLETESARFTQPGDFFVYLVFVCSTILLTSGFLLQGMIFLAPLTVALAYTYAQDNPTRNIIFYIVTFQVKWLPYAMLAMTFVMNGPQQTMHEATGLVAAHLRRKFLLPLAAMSVQYDVVLDVVGEDSAATPNAITIERKAKRHLRNTPSRSSSPALDKDGLDDLDSKALTSALSTSLPSYPPKDHTLLLITPTNLKQLSPMPPVNPIPLLVASIGNPAPAYSNTLHSAGHTVLQNLKSLLFNPVFVKDRSLANGLVSEGDNGWTLWQSPSLMNVSGNAVGDAWKKWRATHEEGALVIVHDELERPLGKVTVRRQGGSARGHNGIKSIMSALPSTPFVRIGIGIGRPESREPADVAKYVLRKMTQQERDRIENCALEVLGALRNISDGP